MRKSWGRHSITSRTFKDNRYAKEPSSENDWPTARKERLKLDRHKCTECGSKESIEVHHVIPRSRGGSNAISNLLTLCDVHHQQKHRHLYKKRWT